MSEEPNSLTYQFTWNIELASELRYYAFSNSIRFILRNFWYIVGISLFVCWGAATAFSKLGIFPAEHLGMILKAIAAGFVAALLPTASLSYLEGAAIRKYYRDGHIVRMKLDKTGCRSNSGKAVSYFPWRVVENVEENPFGVILHLNTPEMFPIFATELYEASSREILMNKIDDWRSASS